MEAVMENTDVMNEFDPMRVYPVLMNQILAEETFNCRGYIDATSVIELAKDIDKNGLDQPITLRPFNDPLGKKKFQIVAGFRRFKAHALLKKTTVNALIKGNMTEVDARIHNLRENLQRAELNIKQEAEAIDHLKFMGRDEIAKRIGKSSGWIQQRLYVLQLPEAIQNEAAAGLLTGAQIRECAQLKSEEEQYEFVKKIKNKKLAKLDAREIKPTKKKIGLKSQVEIFKLQELCIRYCGTCLAGKVLAWAAGHIDIEEIYHFMSLEFEDFKRPDSD